MRFREVISWILDKNDDNNSDLDSQERLFRERRDFVHSLGRKCDRVGWSELDLSDPETSVILERIDTFCRENNWRMRIHYERIAQIDDSEWYELVPGGYVEDPCEDISAIAEDGEPVNINAIRAYREMMSAPKCWAGLILLPERFRDAYLRLGLNGLDFCWAPDKGKYAAEQYFFVYGTEQIPYLAEVSKSPHSKEQLRALGGAYEWLCSMANVEFAHFPVCYPVDALPREGIAYICRYYEIMEMQSEEAAQPIISRTTHKLRDYRILIHKDTAASLLREKALSRSSFQPVWVSKEVPGGYMLRATKVLRRPEAGFRTEMLRGYEGLKLRDRPVYEIREQQAVSEMRREKKARKTDFDKPLPAPKLETLRNTVYAQMIPYYKIASNAVLSEEYRMLSPEESSTVTMNFRYDMSDEDLAKPHHEAVVIAVCPDGDRVLLCPDGTVARYSHEAPVVVETWKTPAVFIFDAINQ